MFKSVLYFALVAIASATSQCEIVEKGEQGFLANFYGYKLKEERGWNPQFFLEDFQEGGIEHTVSQVVNSNFRFCAEDRKVVLGDIYGHHTTISNYTLELTGFFTPTQTGLHAFTIKSDNGVSLQIFEGVSCCNNPNGGNTGGVELSVRDNVGGGGKIDLIRWQDDVYLEAGVHYFVRIVTFNWQGNGGLDVSYVSPDSTQVLDMGSEIYQHVYDTKPCSESTTCVTQSTIEEKPESKPSTSCTNTPVTQTSCTNSPCLETTFLSSSIVNTPETTFLSSSIVQATTQSSSSIVASQETTYLSSSISASQETTYLSSSIVDGPQTTYLSSSIVDGPQTTYLSSSVISGDTTYLSKSIISSSSAVQISSMSIQTSLTFEISASGSVSSMESVSSHMSKSILQTTSLATTATLSETASVTLCTTNCEIKTVTTYTTLTTTDEVGKTVTVTYCPEVTHNAQPSEVCVPGDNVCLSFISSVSTLPMTTAAPSIKSSTITSKQSEALVEKRPTTSSAEYTYLSSLYSDDSTTYTTLYSTIRLNVDASTLSKNLTNNSYQTSRVAPSMSAYENRGENLKPTLYLNFLFTGIGALVSGLALF